ncbi:MAG: restriction endonuclease subunit S [Bacteroides xylanisolvens]
MRFPEFSGEWKKCTIGELAIKVGSGVTPRGGESVYKMDGHSFVRSQNVGLGHLILDDIAFIDEETHLRQKNTELKLEDVLLNITGASIGRSALVNEQVVGGNVNQHVCIIRTKENLISSFLCNFLLSNYGQRQIDSFQAGGNRQGLNFEQIKSIKIAIPSTKEQTKVAKLLQLIEERIATQSKIIEDLKLLKKTMSQNIFSLKIRFKDEEGNVFSSWKLRKLSDVLIIQGGYAFKSSLFNQGTNKVIRIGDILPIIKLSNFSGIYSSETPNEKYIVRKNDFVMALSGATFGKVGKIEDKGIAYINQRVATFRTKQCLEFFYQLVQINNFKNYISSIPTASAQPNISNDDIGNYKSYIPDVMEQTKIAGFLSTIDKKIETERAILDAYAKQKQYLLANLFI